MQKNSMYAKIIAIALVITGTLSLLVLLITGDNNFMLSVLFGAMLSILGFIWIVLATGMLLKSTFASQMAMAHYFARYILYGVAMYLGMQIGLHIVFMLLGFLSINLAIKIYVLLFKKEDSI